MVSALTQINITVENPVTQNKRMTYYGNAILLINAGDETITINNGLTIPVGQAVPIKTGDDENIIVFDMAIRFAGGGTNPRLEIVTSQPEGPEYDNYNPH